LTRPEEVAEHKATFLDVLKGLEAVRKYMCQFVTDNNNTIMCKKVENDLCGLKLKKERKKQKTLIKWLKK
jgi:hypothetical protein